MPKIAVFNKSTSISNTAIMQMMPIFEKQWNRDLSPTWGIEPARFSFVRKGQKPPRGAWWVLFLDWSDRRHAVAYHDLTNEGLPLAKVFVDTLLQDDVSVSVGATHEICEMAVDPWMNGGFLDPKKTFWASEICDPVEDPKYGYVIDGLLVTDFVTPAWYSPKNARGKKDFAGRVRAPFTILSAGYAQQYDNKTSKWKHVAGSDVRDSKRKTPPFGTRRERRARHWTKWIKSKPLTG
jgi:hypothetical protein